MDTWVRVAFGLLSHKSGTIVFQRACWLECENQALLRLKICTRRVVVEWLLRSRQLKWCQQLVCFLCVFWISFSMVTGNVYLLWWWIQVDVGFFGIDNRSEVCGRVASRFQSSSFGSWDSSYWNLCLVFHPCEHVLRPKTIYIFALLAKWWTCLKFPWTHTSLQKLVP